MIDFTVPVSLSLEVAKEHIPYPFQLVDGKIGFPPILAVPLGTPREEFLYKQMVYRKYLDDFPKALQAFAD